MQFINKSLLFVSGIFLLISCAAKEEKTPSSVLTKDNMIQLVIDIQLAEATINLSNYGQSNLPNDKEKLFEAIYKKHHTSKKIVEESFFYYTGHPEQFEKIYEEVITGLSKKQAELSK